MRAESQIARSVFIVDRTLRSMFPRDYDHRCMYVAFGLRDLLRDAGVRSGIVGGDLLVFVVARDNMRATLEGFGGGEVGEDPSHYWVETDETIIDLGPHYLPKRSRYPAAKMPIVAWSRTEPLPAYLRYRPVIQYAPDALLSSDPAIMTRMSEFLERCKSRNKAVVGQPKGSNWLLTGQAALLSAAKQGDLWARGAIRFSSMPDAARLPF